jgi:ABC-type multidrug transport system fused ATPase/permease subunit
LLEKFYEPDSEDIMLDGIPLRKYNTKFPRDNIGLVFHKNHIFSDTIEENIHYSKPDASEA